MWLYINTTLLPPLLLSYFTKPPEILVRKRQKDVVVRHLNRQLLGRTIATLNYKYIKEIVV